MKALVRLLFFLFQAAVVGLAAAFVAVWFKPGLLGIHGLDGGAAPGSYSEAVVSSSPAVVNVHSARRVRQTSASGKAAATQPPPGYPPVAQLESSLGSGVIVSGDGYILTNYHVINGADAIQVGLQDGRVLAARVVGVDPDTDLALLKVDMAGLKPIQLGRSDDLKVGDVVLAIGDPYGVGQTVTQGIVSATGRSQLGLSTFENFIQTDAAINPGNSGGALIDAGGNLIGINTAIFSRSGGSMGIGFAIPVSTAKMVLEQIIKSGSVTRGWIGVEVQELSPQAAESFKLGDTRGALIAGVLRGGPADKAGVKPGDVLYEVEGKPVVDPSSMLNVVAALAPGTNAHMKLKRKGQNVETDVAVGRRPKPQPRPAD
jgi:serine protease DegQ